MIKSMKRAAALFLGVAVIASGSAAVYAEESTEGMYRSELTNELIPIELQQQRPIAAMVDNESIALDHYGVNQADIVYEMVNSYHNDYITRLMCIVKDWKNLSQFGNIRSVRPTNFMVAAEYEAIICHDGGPDALLMNYYPYADHISGGFARFDNGKSSEFTEYITSEPTNGAAGLIDRITSEGLSPVYTERYSGQQFQFSDAELSLMDKEGAFEANSVSLPFPHNSSELRYNAETQKYEYYEYGNPHVDALTGEVTSFKNVIVQIAPTMGYDAGYYMVYGLLGGSSGYFLTDGYAIPIYWNKTSEAAPTWYHTATETITLNTGHTYIGIVPTEFAQNLSFNG